MQEESEFFNPLTAETDRHSSHLEQALDELERSFSRFERVLSRYQEILRGQSGITTRRTSRRTIISQSISRAIRLFSGQDLPTRTPDFNPYGTQNNRFPISYGQTLADFASSISLFGGRNR